MCDEMAASIKNSVGKKKLKSAINYLLDSQREEARRQEKSQSLDFNNNNNRQSSHQQEDDDEEEEVVKSFYNPKLLEKAKDAIYLRDRAMILKYRIAALKSRQCKSSENKQYCPEAFLNVIAEKLTYTVILPYIRKAALLSHLITNFIFFFIIRPLCLYKWSY